MKHTASSQCALTNVKRGQRMTISAISSCWSTGTIILRDDRKIYATLKNDKATNRHQLLDTKSLKYTGGKNLRVEIELENSTYDIKIRQTVTNTNMINSDGKVIGNIYTIAIEDLSDNEYNDFVITILITNK